MNQTNQREDAYSASDCPLHFLHRIVSSIRLSGLLPETFVVGVKLNAGDYTSLRSTESNSSNTHDEEQEKRALQHVQEIANWRMFDFIEISGGDYESPSEQPAAFGSLLSLTDHMIWYTWLFQTSCPQIGLKGKLCLHGFLKRSCKPSIRSLRQHRAYPHPMRGFIDANLWSFSQVACAQSLSSPLHLREDMQISWGSAGSLYFIQSCLE